MELVQKLMKKTLKYLIYSPLTEIILTECPCRMLKFLVMLLIQVSLAWSLVVYHRSLRYTYPHKKNISLAGTLFQVDIP